MKRARRAFPEQVDRFDRGQMFAAEPFGQVQPAVAAAPRVHFGLDGRRRGREYDRDFAMRARTTAMSRA